MSLVRFQNISKRFDGRQVLREVFFRLENGDRVGLIGKNGSGKTTALKMSAASSKENRDGKASAIAEPVTYRSEVNRGESRPSAERCGRAASYLSSLFVPFAILSPAFLHPFQRPQEKVQGQQCAQESLVLRKIHRRRCPAGTKEKPHHRVLGQQNCIFPFRGSGQGHPIGRERHPNPLITPLNPQHNGSRPADPGLPIPPGKLI